MFAQITMIDYARPLAERAKARKTCGPYTWAPAKPGNGRGFYQSSKGLYMDRHGSSLDLRLEEANDHLRGTRLAFTTGYYCDEFGDDTLQPIVARLPSRRGFLAGWTMGRGMCASLDSHIWETIEDAARAAHDEAAYWAEENRRSNMADDEDENEDA